LVDADKDRIRLSATDLEVSISSTIKGEVAGKGAITIPAKKFSDIVRELPEAEVSVEVEGEKMRIRCEKASFMLIGLPADEFPQLPTFEKKRAVQWDAALLGDALRKTKFAVSTDETRYVLNGVLLEVKEDHARLVATDGKRLTYIQKDISVSDGIEFRGIVPIKAINELSRILGRGSEGDAKEVSVGLGENQINFTVGDTSLTSRLIEGQFPNYSQVIPQKYERKVKTNTQSMIHAIRRMSIFADEIASSIKMNIGKDRINITTNTPGVGEASEDVEVSMEGSDISIAFSPGYILDALKNIDTEEVNLQLTSELGPSVIRPEGPEDYLCIVMPMRLE
jgi:DNA polymerase-3 subunit beta